MDKKSLEIMVDDYKTYLRDSVKKSFAGIVGQLLFNKNGSYDRCIIRVDRIEDKFFYGTKLFLFNHTAGTKQINYTINVRLFDVDHILEWIPITKQEIDDALSEHFEITSPFMFFN